MRRGFSAQTVFALTFGTCYRCQRPKSSFIKYARKDRIHRLALTDFRNYAAASLRFDGRHVVLTGDNGSGKTNLMEAVSFLSPGRGFRRAAYADVVRNGAEAGFSVFAAIEGMNGEADIGTGTEAGRRAASRAGCASMASRRPRSTISSITSASSG